MDFGAEAWAEAVSKLLKDQQLRKRFGEVRCLAPLGLRRRCLGGLFGLLGWGPGACFCLVSSLVWDIQYMPKA